MPEITPDDITTRRFRSTFRGFDPQAVADHLAIVAEAMSELLAQRDQLQARLTEMGDRDLEQEFAAVGREVAEVLEAARQAAEQMRERASADATRWRSEAVAEAEATLRRARADAEQLRSDAWSTGEELLKQAMAESDRIGSSTEQERLRMVGQAERESHRLVSTARREADELVRSAKMEADRLMSEAQAERDRIIQQANRSAEAAQERTRALELRREQLRSELDEIRHALATVEGELEDRRAALALSPATVDVDEEPEAHEDDQVGEWAFGETVRVVRPASGPVPQAEPVVADSAPEITVLSADELAQRTAGHEESAPGEPLDVFEEDRTEEPSGEDDEVGEDSEDAGEQPAETFEELEEEVVAVDVTIDEASVPEDDPVEAVASVEIEHVEVVDAEEAGAPVSDGAEPVEPPVRDQTFEELSGLFDRLRDPDAAPAASLDEPAADAEHRTDPAGAEELDEVSAPQSPSPVRYEGDPFELKAGLLMPIANRSLRNVKRQLTEAQNEALEELRLSDGEWEPDGPSLAARLRPDLTVLVSESFAAGHAAAVEMSGERLTRPTTPKTEVENDWVAALIRELNHALGEGRRQGQGSRELGASVSRVFRSWRTDEAERRVSEVASDAYHSALSEILVDGGYSVLWEVAGRGCPACRTNAESVPSEWPSVPPAHSGCGCTLVIA